MSTIKEKCGVVLLPNGNEFNSPPILKGIEEGEDELVSDFQNDPFVYFKDCTYYHLYITSNEEETGITKEELSHDISEGIGMGYSVNYQLEVCKAMFNLFKKTN